MADGLSVAASLLAVATAALQSIQYLSKTIDNIKDAPVAIRSINADLQAIESVLHRVELGLQSRDQSVVLCDEIKPAVANCDRACKAFQETLQRWAKYSTSEKMFWVGKWKVALLGQDRIQTFRSQLNDCKHTLSIALSVSNILAMARNGVLLEGMKDAMLQQNEVALQQEMARADRERTALEDNSRRLVLSDEHTDPSIIKALQISRQDLIEEIRQQEASNKTMRRTCEEGISRLAYERTGHTIRGTGAKDHGTALAGFINTPGEGFNTQLNISDTTADGHGFAAAGVIMNIDLRHLRQDRSSTARQE